MERRLGGIGLYEPLLRNTAEGRARDGVVLPLRVDDATPGLERYSGVYVHGTGIGGIANVYGRHVVQARLHYPAGLLGLSSSLEVYGRSAADSGSTAYLLHDKEKGFVVCSTGAMAETLVVIYSQEMLFSVSEGYGWPHGSPVAGGAVNRDGGSIRIKGPHRGVSGPELGEYIVTVSWSAQSIKPEDLASYAEVTARGKIETTAWYQVVGALDVHKLEFR
jgi:hypothetical protein